MAQQIKTNAWGDPNIVIESNFKPKPTHFFGFSGSN